MPIKKVKTTKREVFSSDDISGKPKVKEIFPSIHLSEKNIPEIKDWQVGIDYVVTFRLRQTEKIQRKDEPARADFDITEYELVKVIEPKKKKTASNNFGK